MLKLHRIKSIDECFFDKAWDLYDTSFPIDERRLSHAQNQLFSLPAYHFEVILHHEQFIGFMLWWDFDHIRFIEHLATIPEVRGAGFGRSIIQQFQQEDDRLIILETELPQDDLSCRRIHFYERLGFNVNKHYYSQPPIQPGRNPVELLLLSYPDILHKEDVDAFVSKYHPIIYP